MTDYFGDTSESFADAGISFEWARDEPDAAEAPGFQMPTIEGSITVPLTHADAVRLVDRIGDRRALRGSAVCACHQLPFPAARDYRRRTKHRNRRRR